VTFRLPPDARLRADQADRRSGAQGADLMRHKTLLAERSQSTSAGRAPISKPTAVAKARDACHQAPASAKIGRFVFCQTGRAELQPSRLNPGCTDLLGPWPQGQTQPGRPRRRAAQPGLDGSAGSDSRGDGAGAVSDVARRALCKTSSSPSCSAGRKRMSLKFARVRADTSAVKMSLLLHALAMLQPSCPSLTRVGQEDSD
jgi:hypothetical protein